MNTGIWLCLQMGDTQKTFFFLNVFREDMIHIRGSQKPMTSKTWVEFQQRSKDGDSTLSASFFVTS